MRPRLALAAGVAVLAAGCTCRSYPGTRYILPDHFHGCIAVGLGVPGAKPLPRQDGFQVVEVTRAGQRFETSDGLPAQERIVDEIWKRTPSGLRRTEDEPTGEWSVQHDGGPLYAVVCFEGGEDAVDLEFPLED